MHRQFETGGSERAAPVARRLGAVHHFLDHLVECQDAINKAGPGEATPPFFSPAGIEMMVRCDKRAPAINVYTIPARQQVEEQLFDQQITMLSRRYIRDLRRSANVETR